MTALPMPETPNAATPEWLTDALRSTGALTEGRVTAVTTEPIGEGVGVFGQLGKLTVSYDSPGAGPSTLVIKMDTDAEVNRAAADGLGFYEREVNFYKDLAPSLDLRTPACYYAEYRRSDGRVILLLEDLSHLRPGDQVAGASPAQARVAIQMAAKLHAKYWQGSGDPIPDWVPAANDPDQIKNLTAIFQPTFEQVLADRGDQLSPASHRVYTELLDWEPYLQRMSKPPRTLVHGDFRFDNLLFGDDPDDETVLLDWQIVYAAQGVWDVALFLVESMQPDVRRAHEDELLHLYHDTLRDEGVRDYGFDQLMLDYRHAVMVTTRGAVLLYSFETGNERGEQLGQAMFNRGLAAFDDHRCDELFPLG